MLALAATVCGLALWQTTGSAGSSIVRLTPTRISRLALPVYGAEHLLLLACDDASTDVLPVLLRYREGEQLEQLGDAAPSASSGTPLGVECAARGRIFRRRRECA